MKTIIITAILLFTTIGFGQTATDQCKTLYQQLEVKLGEEKVLREKYYSLLKLASNSLLYAGEMDSSFIKMQAIVMKLDHLENVYAKLVYLNNASLKLTMTYSYRELNRQFMDSMNAGGYRFNSLLSELTLPVFKLELIADRSQTEYLSYLQDFDQSLQEAIKKEQLWIEECKRNQQYMRHILVVFESLKPQYLRLINQLEEMDVERLLEQERLNYQQNGPTGFSEQYAEVYPGIFETQMDVFSPKELPEPENVLDIYEVTDVPAMFSGGREAMNEFLKKNIKIPSGIIKNELSGKVILKFVVSSSGDISDVKLLKGMTDCEECDKEAIRVVRMMPNWIPGMMKDKPVNSWYTLPIKFEFNQ